MGVALSGGRFSALLDGHVALLHSGHSSTATASSAPRVRTSARRPATFQRWLILGGLKKKKRLEFIEKRLDSAQSDSTAVWLVARPSILERHRASGAGPRGFSIVSCSYNNKSVDKLQTLSLSLPLLSQHKGACSLDKSSLGALLQTFIQSRGLCFTKEPRFVWDLLQLACNCQL